MAFPSWSAAQYAKFEDERTRPAIDLLTACPPQVVARAVDLGCGTGSSTQLVVDRYPGAKVVGVDSSEVMLLSAQERLPEMRFIKANVSDWRPSERQDLIFANAVLQWLPDHEELFPSLLEHVVPSGTLAIQMPDNLEEPSHRAMRKVASDPRWAHKMGPALTSRTVIGAVARYYSILRPLSRRVDIWRTTYHHPMAGPRAIAEWFMGSGLRPFLDLLNASEKEEFLSQYVEEVAEAYPEDSSGISLLPFPRLFIVAVRS